MTPNFALQKNYSKESKKWCVAPNTLQGQSSFLVLCDTELEAQNIIDDISSGKIGVPSESSTNWEKVDEMHNREKTPIFVRKASETGES